jgi:hypothetical protein
MGGLIIAEVRDDDAPAASDADAQAVRDLAEMAEAAEDARPCGEVFAPGRPVADVLAEADASGMCERGPDDRLLTGFVTWDCPDGTTIHQASDGQGWGRDGQTWQGPDVPEPYADCVLPGADPQHPVEP